MTAYFRQIYLYDKRLYKFIPISIAQMSNIQKKKKKKKKKTTIGRKSIFSTLLCHSNAFQHI